MKVGHPSGERGMAMKFADDGIGLGAVGWPEGASHTATWTAPDEERGVCCMEG